MANTKKKGIVVPKPTTVSMRKYSELKAKYEALQEENKKQAALIFSQAEDLKRLQSKSVDGQTMHAAVNASPIVNQEFIVLDKVVNLVHNLNPFQRRTVIAGLLSSIKERMKAEATERLKQCRNRKLEGDIALEELSDQENGMRAMAEIIGNFGLK